MHICRGVLSVSNMSLQVVPSVFGFKSVDMEGQGRILDVVGDELCGVACCMQSSIVMLKYSALRLMHKIKRQKDMCFFF